MNLCLFDLDDTLLPLDSDHAWGEFVVRQGWVDAAEFARSNDAFYAQYKAGTLDIHAYIEFATRPWRDRPASEMDAAHQRFMAEVILPLHPAAAQLVRHHQAQGDLVAIVTATNEFVTAPIGRAFGVEHLLAVELERGPAGNITGRIDGTPSFREGKTVRTQQWLAGLGHRLQDFERISVYSDSANDLPLLELATDPVATNPSAPLEAIARERGWRILRLFS
ncbi:MAG TPA: HAD family phosphatase [Rhizobacter sp.]|nr:HAD family phosphatase [Rhizobacter sp.]